MGRILFFVLLAIAAYIGWQWMNRSTLRDQRRRERQEASPQAMVGCAVCGLHLPRQEALVAGDQFYCCEEHRQRGRVSS
jgi:uncharacterized protein